MMFIVQLIKNPMLEKSQILWSRIRNTGYKQEVSIALPKFFIPTVQWKYSIIFRILGKLA